MSPTTQELHLLWPFPFAESRDEQIELANVDRSVRFKIPKPDKLPNPLLRLDRVTAGYDERPILTDVSLSLTPGTRIGLIGHNGAGKSTLARVLAGDPQYQVTRGPIHFLGQDLLALEPQERSLLGLFVSFQYPVEIPGVSNVNFLRTAINEIRDANGENPISAKEFMALVREKSKIVELDSSLASRSVNEGFSGGEKKRNEIFQMAMLNPKLAVLDETDSGLDIDALRIVAKGVNSLKSPENASIVITHYQRLLDYIVPDYVHVLYDGRIVKTGDKNLALELEEKGYDWIKAETQVG